MTNWNQSQPAPQKLWTLVHTNFPVTRNLGIYYQDHDDHGEGRALDIGLLVSKPEENRIAWGLIEDVLVPLKDEIAWSYFIWDQWIWYPDKRGKQKGGFTGNHTNHIHVSWSRANSQKIGFPQTEKALSDLRKLLSGEERQTPLMPIDN
ncbi:MAG: hypothetical protein H6971_08470 [Gammaproteobacteria bacterium]|nr:hypothetical protein [Gammaproteobacteria bacterium]